MANPVTTIIPEWQWTLVATNVSLVTFDMLKSNVTYHWTYRTTGSPAPAPIEQGKIPAEAVRLFEKNIIEAIKSSIGIDIYIMGSNHDDDADDEGLIRVDLDVGEVAAGGSSVQPMYVSIVENEAPSIEAFLAEELNDVTILSLSPDGKQMTLAPGHGFLPPSGYDIDYLNLHYVDPAIPGFVGTWFRQLAIVAVTGDVIDITTPIGMPALFNVANITSSKRVNINMAVAGSRAAPARFCLTPPGIQEWQLRRYIGDMILDTQPDDGLFGDIPLLAYGEYFGFESDVYTAYTLKIRDNGGYRATGYDVYYADASRQGQYGMSFRKTLAGLDKSGVVVELDGAGNDCLVKYTQDDLTGLVRYRIKVMGNIKQQP